MSKENTLDRRSFLGIAAASIAAAEVSVMRAAYANAGQPKRLQRLEPIKQINAGVLDVGYHGIGPNDGPKIMLLTGGN